MTGKTTDLERVAWAVNDALDNPDLVEGAAMLAARAATRAVLEGLMEPSEDTLMAAHRSTASWLGLPGPKSALSQALAKHRIRWQAMLKHKLAELEKEG